MSSQISDLSSGKDVQKPGDSCSDYEEKPRPQNPSRKSKRKRNMDTNNVDEEEIVTLMTIICAFLTCWWASSYGSMPKKKASENKEFHVIESMVRSMKKMVEMWEMKLNQDDKRAEIIYDALQEMEKAGFSAEVVSDAYDYLMLNGPISAGFLKRTHEMKVLWMNTFIRNHCP